MCELNVIEVGVAVIWWRRGVGAIEVAGEESGITEQHVAAWRDFVGGRQIQLLSQVGISTGRGDERRHVDVVGHVGAVL